MLILLNLTIVVYLAAMFYYWGAVQGLLSAVLHLACVVAAGALALALWQPLTVGLLLDHIGAMGWAIGLIVPFVILLLALRFTVDFLVRDSIEVHRAADIVAGGACGALAGVLTAGLTIIALTFLAGDKSVLGYQALVLNSSGHVAPNPEGQLWLAVDKDTAGFYRLVSAGAFSAGKPLKLYDPDFTSTDPDSGKTISVPGLVSQASGMAITRTLDPNSSLLATPACVTVTRVLKAAAPLPALSQEALNAIGANVAKDKGMLVVVDTQWDITAPGGRDVFDGGVLHVSVSQASLIAWDGADLDQARHGWASFPVAAAAVDTDGAKKLWTLSADPSAMLTGKNSKQVLTFVFFLPGDQGQFPHFIQLRNIRIDLPPALNGDAGAIERALGLAGGLSPPAGPVRRGSARPGAPLAPRHEGGSHLAPPARPAPLRGLTIEATDHLPYPIVKTAGLRFGGTNAVTGGQATAAIVPEMAGGDNVVEVLAPAPGQAVVRVQVARNPARELLGQIVANALIAAPLTLRTEQGDPIQPFAYVWVMLSARKLTVFSVPGTTIARMGTLPIKEMAPGDQLYLYFQVPHGSKIIALGRASDRSFDQRVIPALNVP